MEIIFESHATSLDNEAGRASGWNDVALSPTGEAQARQMGERYAGQTFDALFCSDLQRSYNTARLAFGDKFPIITDNRLRECDYGDLEQKGKELIESERPTRIHTPFPNGESLDDAVTRVAEFLHEIHDEYAGKRIMIIGHRATHYGIEHTVSGKPLEEIAAEVWTWQPGWKYQWA
jgi:broad specificity phosphatase PhoE